MADKQWFLTKLIGALMGLMLLISMVVGLSNMHYDLKRDVRGNTTDISDNKKEGSEELKAIKNDLSEVKSVQTEIRLNQREQTTHYAHILREVEKLNIKFDTFEVNQ